jgi:hypothetical protein
VLGASSGRSFPASSTKANSTRSANRAGFAQTRRQVTNEQREQRRKLGSWGHLVAPQPLAHVMAGARRAIAQKYGGVAKGALD